MSGDDDKQFPMEWWGAFPVRNFTTLPASPSRPRLLFKADGTKPTDLDALPFETEADYFVGDVIALATPGALDLLRLCFESGLVEAARARHTDGRELTGADVERCVGAVPSFRTSDERARAAAFAGALALAFANPEVDAALWSRDAVLTDLEQGWPPLRFDLLPGDVAFEVGVILQRFADVASGVEHLALRRLSGDQPLVAKTEEAKARAKAWEAEACRLAQGSWLKNPTLSQDRVAELIEPDLFKAGWRNARGDRVKADSIARAIKHCRPTPWRK